MGCSSSKDTQNTQGGQHENSQNETRDTESPVSHHNPEFVSIHSPEGSVVVEREKTRTPTPDEVQQEFEVLITGADRSTTTTKRSDSRATEDSDVFEEEWRKHLKEQKQELLLEQLRVATYLRDRIALVRILPECYSNDDVKGHTDVTKGQRVLNRLIARDALREAVHRRSIEDIETELKNIKSRGYSKELKQHIVEARIAIDLIQREQTGSDNLMVPLDKKTMSEIRRYQSPPAMMHRVIQATLLLLGEEEYTTEEWQACQKLMNPQGSSGLSRKFHNFSIHDVHPEICARSKYILLEEMFDIRTDKPVDVKSTQNRKKKQEEEVSEEDKQKYWRTYDLATIQKVSPTAVPFYVWSMGVIDEYEQNYGTDFESVEPASKDRQVAIFEEEYEYYYRPKQKSHPKQSQNTGKYVSTAQDSYHSNSNTGNSYQDYLDREN